MSGEPEAAASPLTEDEVQEYKQYGNQQLVCDLLDTALDLVFLTLFAIFAADPVLDWIRTQLNISTLSGQLSVFFLVMTAAHYLVSFPLSFYSGHLLESRYNLSNMTAGKWLQRYLRRAGVVTALGLLLMLGLFWTIWLGGAWWWLIATAATYFVGVILGQLFPVVFLPLFYKVEPLEDAELTERLERLSDGTSLNIEGVFRLGMSVETRKANAMLAGLGRTRRVILSDTLLNEFEPNEIEVVFAHEVGHHVYRHILKFMALGLVTSAAGFLLCDVAIRAMSGDGLNYAQLSPAMLPWISLVLSASSLALSPIQNAISRRFEVQCDLYALQKTQDRAGFRSAFTKLAKLNKADPDPHPLEVFLFHDHPSIKERLALAED